MFQICGVKFLQIKCLLSTQASNEALTNKKKHPFNGPLSGTTQVSRYQKGKTNLDFTEARDSEWQWLQLGYMQVCTSLQTENHASTPPLSFLQAGCPSCRPTNTIKALKASQSTEGKRRTNNKMTINNIRNTKTREAKQFASGCNNANKP